MLKAHLPKACVAAALLFSVSMSAEAQSATDGATPGEDVSLQAAYDAAVELLKAGDYKKAAAAFSTFGAEWPKSAYAADAVYWRGSCLFALEQYKSTINVQNSLIRSYPKHPRVADAMISVASSQAALGNVKAASATLAKVIKQYPNSDAAKTAAQLQKTLK